MSSRRSRLSTGRTQTLSSLSLVPRSNGRTPVWSGVARTYRGRDGLREWFDEVMEAWESIHVEVEETAEAADDRAFVGLFLTGRGAGSGVETKLRAWQVNWFADGKTARRRVFLERDEALEAAGLRA